MNKYSKIFITALVLPSLVLPHQVTDAATPKPKACTIKVTYNKKLYKINKVPIANKVYGMSRSYNPGANKTMVSAYHKMKADALKKGVYLDVVGAYGAYGFRSYQTQAMLYNNYIYQYGYNYASKISAKPGTSEHQLGLAMDIKDGTNYGTLTTAFEYTKASQYLKANAHKYGFIIRYLKGKEKVTGFMYEPWHIRYVGKTHATKIKKYKVTLEEYLGIAGKKKLKSGSYKVKGYSCY